MSDGEEAANRAAWTVRDNVERKRFEIDLGGGAFAFAEYTLPEGIIMFTHTEVPPEHGGKGIGKALLVNLARRCVAEGLGRFEWWVLEWNEPSIDFYKSQGGVMQDEWTKVRVDGEALLALGRN